MSGDRQILQAPGPGPLLITKRRYTIPELYRLRETLRFLFCPLANFSPEAFEYLIVTPHIPASAHIDPQIRQKILWTLVKIDKERMASTPFKKVLPPHLRLKASQPGPAATPAAAPATLDPITPLTVIYGNVVGNEPVKEPEPEPKNTKPEPKTTQQVDRATAESWWAKLSGEHKIGIAEPYILEGRELPTASVHNSATKPGLNPTVPSFNMGALRDVVPNVPSVVAKQDEWGSSSFAAIQHDWNTNAPTKTDDWNVSPIQTTANEWGSSSAAPVKAIADLVKATAAPVKATAAPVKATADLVKATAAPVKASAAPVLVKATATPVKATAAPVKGDDWNISSATSTKHDWNTTSSKQHDNWSTPPTTSQPLISIDPESPTAPIEGTTVKLIPPHKSAWIGLKSNGEEQDEFIRFMTAKVFPRIIQSTPKKPVLDTTYVTENPDPAPADDFAAATSKNWGSDW
ncbi:hypothetical protein EV426DRAFT_608310 [Tirmania nivea]|nr:hypothetical protein EV426DRAFT_608310 [Tirmania nivea]